MVAVCATCRIKFEGKNAFNDAILHCEDYAHTIVIKIESDKEPQIIIMKGIK